MSVAADQVGKCRLADGIGGAQVEIELGVEHLDRGLVHPRSGGEAADEVDDAEQGGVGVVARQVQGVFELLLVGEVGLDEPEVRMCAHSLELVTDQPRHHDPPSGVE